MLIPEEENNSILTIDKKDKVQVILSVMRSIRGHITEWQGRAYTSTVWSIGTMIAVGTYCLNKGDNLGAWERIFFAISILFFLFLGHIYLNKVKSSLEENGRVLVRCETALKLNKPTEYLKGERFFGFSSLGEWVPPKDISTLSSLQLVVGLFVILSILFLNCPM